MGYEFHSPPDTRWLSQYPGHILEFYCSRCGAAKRYDADRTLARLGDQLLRGMCVQLADHMKCPRVYSLGPDPCRMIVHAEPRRKDATGRLLHGIALSKAGLRIERDMSFSEVMEWHVLYASCQCGRIKHLEREKWVKRHKKKKLGDVAKRLKCNRCGIRGKADFAIANLPR